MSLIANAINTNIQRYFGGYDMEKVRLGIIGIGNMGSGHSKNIVQGKVEDIVWLM